MQNTTSIKGYAPITFSRGRSGHFHRFMLALLLLNGLFLAGCKSAKTTTSNKSSNMGDGENVVSDRSALFKEARMDTAGALAALAGDWQLGKICQSTYVGLNCDTTRTMLVKVDKAGGIQWSKDGQTELSDSLHFERRSGSGTGVAKGDSIWVLSMAENDHSYLVQKLKKDTLQLAEYPLIMDKTTTYYLHK